MRPRLSFVVLMMLVVASCDRRMTSADFDSTNRWLSCDDCMQGERRAVSSRGNHIVPLLREVLLFMPTANEQAVVKQQAANEYLRLSPPGTQQQYVDRVFANYLARRQTRAALSLSDIHTDRARTALAEAVDSLVVVQYRADVARTLRYLYSVWTASPFVGVVTKRNPQFGDSVVVVRPPNAPPFSARAVALIDSSPFPASSLLYVWRPDTLIFGAVGTAGTHSVSIVDSTVSAESRVFTIAIASEADRNDRASRICTTVACLIDSAEVVSPPRLPITRFQSLTSAGTKIDTVDMFKITAPGGALPVTARLDWESPGLVANLDLRWRTCNTFVPTGNTDGATAANKPETTSVVIPPGQCWILLVLGPTQPGVASVFARLRVTSP